MEETKDTKDAHEVALEEFEQVCKSYQKVYDAVDCLLDKLEALIINREFLSTHLNKVGLAAEAAKIEELYRI